jgi:hypothetical protein
MKVRALDGEVFTGRGYNDIVNRMALGKLVGVRNLSSYRNATAKRVSELYGVIIDATSDETFIKTLIAAKVLERVS